MLIDSSAYHNGQYNRISSNIGSLKAGETAAIKVDSKGHLHFFYKGKHQSVICEGLPIKPLWGFVDVYGKAGGVKVELLHSECYIIIYCFGECKNKN